MCRKFIKSKDSLKILFSNTDQLYKKNLRINTDSIPESDIDSVSIANSVLLGKIINKTLIGLINNGIGDELKKRKFKIYSDDSLTAFMKLQSKAYIFNLSQIELDEYLDIDTAFEQIDDQTYFQELFMNAESINLWFEVSQLNGDQEQNQVLFSSQNISDNIDGYFKRDIISGQVKFYYKRANVNADDVYLMAEDFGTTNAGYIFDYLINEYVHLNYKGNKKIQYMHYNPRRRIVYPAGFDRFIFMK